MARPQHGDRGCQAPRTPVVVTRASVEDALLHHEAGVQHARAGDMDRAIQHFERALTLCPQLQRDKGLARQRGDALAICRETAALRSAQASRENGTLRKEEETQRRNAATAHNREAAASFFEIAREALEKEDYDLALRRVERAIELHPWRADDAHRDAARVYFEWRQALVILRIL